MTRVGRQKKWKKPKKLKNSFYFLEIFFRELSKKPKKPKNEKLMTLIMTNFCQQELVIQQE